MDAPVHGRPSLAEQMTEDIMTAMTMRVWFDIEAEWGYLLKANALIRIGLNFLSHLPDMPHHIWTQGMVMWDVKALIYIIFNGF